MLVGLGAWGSAVSAAEQHADAPGKTRMVWNTTRTLEHHNRIARNNDGTYTVNLETKVPRYNPQALDIIVAIDTSNSTQSTQQFDDIKKAAENALERLDKFNRTIAKSPKSRHRAALVKFSGKYAAATGNARYREGSLNTNYTQVVTPLTDNIPLLKSALNELQEDDPRPTDGPRDFREVITTIHRAARHTRFGQGMAGIVLSRGAPVDTDSAEPFAVQSAHRALDKANYLKAACGYPIYTIGAFDNASVDGTDNTNLFLQGLSNNYPAAGSLFEGHWEQQDGSRTWVVSQHPENLGPGNRHNGFYKAAPRASQLSQAFTDICTELGAAFYTEASITHALSQYAKPEGIVYSEAADNNGFHMVTAGVELRHTGKSAAPEPGRDYDLWFNPSGNGTLQVRFSDRYKLALESQYTLAFRVKPSQNAYDTLARNAKNGKTGIDLYNGSQGSADTDMPGNETSSNKPGFAITSTAGMDYFTIGGRQHVDYTDRPVVQAATSTLNIVATWQGVAAKPSQLNVTVTQDDTVTPVTLKPDTNGTWKSTLIIPAGDAKTYRIQAESLAPLWSTTYRHRLDGLPSKQGDTIVIPESSTPQNATVTIINSQAQATLPANSISVTSTLTGWHTPRDFTFTMQATGENAGGVVWPSASQRSSSVTARGASTFNPVTASFSDQLVFAVPKNTSKQEHYTLTITQNDAGEAPQGWKYDDQPHNITVTVAYNTQTGAWEATARPTNVQFTNRYVAAIKLPLTGGNGRDRLLMGGIAIGITGLVLAGAGLFRAREKRAERRSEADSGTPGKRR